MHRALTSMIEKKAEYSARKSDIRSRVLGSNLSASAKKIRGSGQPWAVAMWRNPAAALPAPLPMRRAPRAMVANMSSAPLLPVAKVGLPSSKTVLRPFFSYVFRGRRMRLKFSYMS